MSLPLNIAILGAEDPSAAQEFYAAALAPSVQAGAVITVAPSAQEWGGSVGCFTYPDGIAWKIASS